MQLKEIVDNLLKERNRSLSWLASQIGKTFDGLRLSLIKESVKYSDLKKMAEALGVSPGVFFEPSYENYEDYVKSSMTMQEDVFVYKTTKTELDACRELAERLKDQIKDKERIIELLNNNAK